MVFQKSGSARYLAINAIKDFKQFAWANKLPEQILPERILLE
jgi:hypothetical protein